MQILRKTKKILRGILEKTGNAIQLRLGYAHWLHIGDVLAPCRGKMTGGQFIVASRILDIERIRSGTNPYWQNHLCETIYGEKMTEAHKAKSNDGFMRLVESIDARGLNPAFAQCSIANHPLVLNNGTHRVAYLAATGKNGYLPFVCTQRDSKPWFPLDGRGYFSKRGLDGRELDLLEEYYRDVVLKNVRTWLTALICQDYIAKFEQELAGFGEIVASSRKVDFDGGGGQILHIKLHSQELFASGINIYSNPVSKIAKRMDCLGNWGEFAHTVTDSIALECRIEDLMRQRLDFQRKSSK